MIGKLEGVEGVSYITTYWTWVLVPLYVIGWSDIALFYYFENGHIAVDQVGTFLYIQFLLIGKVFNYENKKF